MRLILRALYCCPYCMRYVYALDTEYWCDACDIYYDKSTLEEVRK